MACPCVHKHKCCHSCEESVLHRNKKTKVTHTHTLRCRVVAARRRPLCRARPSTKSTATTTTTTRSASTVARPFTNKMTLPSCSSWAWSASLADPQASAANPRFQSAALPRRAARQAACCAFQRQAGVSSASQRHQAAPPSPPWTLLLRNTRRLALNRRSPFRPANPLRFHRPTWSATASRP